MKFLFILLVAIGSLNATISMGQQSQSSFTQLYNDVAYLSHDSLEGREIGTKGELIAARYIANRFEEIGLDPLNNQGSYFQEFSRKVKSHPHDTAEGIEISGRNVIGILQHGKEGTILIGAHYDHLGWGGKGSGSLSTDHAIHNGADDNASGIAGLLYLAEYFKQNKTEHNIIFVAFTGEEKGLLGSNFFANNTLSAIGETSFMINMDMIGRLDEERRLAVYGIGTSPFFMPTLESIAEPQFKLAVDSSGMGPSDHTSFYLQDIPVLHFFTGQHEQYHKPEDDLEYINFEGLYDVSQFISKLILTLDKENDLPFQKTNDSNKQNEKRTFNVTLGVIPDYLFDGVGLKIDGVKEKRSAALSGIEKGDILLELGTFTITSIYDYMEALGYYHPGDTVSAKIERKGEIIPMEITFVD